MVETAISGNSQQINGREGETATLLFGLSVKLGVAWRRFRPTSSQPLGFFSSQSFVRYFMQRCKYFLASFVATVCLLSYVVFAQTKTQSSPVVISAVAPVFSPAVRALVLEGDYRVDVEIDRSGKVISSKSAESTRKIMRQITEEAADRWQFAPDENAESKRRIQITFTFSSVPKAAKSDSTTIFYPPYKIEVRDNREYPVMPSFRVK